MKRTSKVLYILLPTCISVFIVLLFTGVFSRIFMGSNHNDFIDITQLSNKLGHLDGPKFYYSGQAYANFMRTSFSLFYAFYIVSLIMYGLDIMKRLKESSDKIIWFIIILVTCGIGMIVYFFKYIWNEEPIKVNELAGIAPTQN